MCCFCLGSKTASTSSKQRGCPQKTFSATPSKVEPKVTEKTKKERNRKRNQFIQTSNKNPKNKHLTYLHWVTEQNKDWMGRLKIIITKCRLDCLSTFSLWLCSSFRVVLLHVSTPESLTCGSHHAKSSSNECPPKRTIFFCLSDKVCVGSDINVCSIVFLFPLWLSPTGVG